ncbi:Gm12216 [Phodopus roborovskii]|uniref:Gm12216 protein n=1 Tax=Phodopus roborovskii TaxID=109678 RepID=A0AAU9Z2A0_PHORO|nr:Gm12216 [Phodopus roborovskii]
MSLCLSQLVYVLSVQPLRQEQRGGREGSPRPDGPILHGSHAVS